MSGIFGGISNAVGSVGDALGSAASGIGSGLEGLFSGGATGQPAGGAAATPAALAQAAPSIPSIDGAVSGASSPLGVAGAAGGLPNDTSMLDMFKGPSGGAGMAGGGIDMSLPGMLSAGGTDPTGGGGTAAAATHPSLLKDAIGALPVALSVLKSNQTPAAEKQLQALAGNAESQQGINQNLANTAIEGNLPGGAEIGIQQALAAAQAQIRASYATMHLTGSSAEAQDLAAAEQRAQSQRFEIGQQMAQTGLSQATANGGMAANLYKAILDQDTARGTELSDALSKYAAGLVH